MSADTFLYAQLQPYALSGGGAIAGATSITLKSMLTIDGAALTMATAFGTIGFGTLEPGNGTNEEQICFTGLTNNSNGTTTLTGVKSVLFIAPYTQSSGLAKTHAGSTTFIISNTAGFYDELSGKANDETVTGLWTFPDADATRARITSDTDTAVATAFVTLGQLSRQAISGASNASTAVKGIVELATQAEVDAKTTTGGTGALLVPTPDTQRSTLLSDYKADTGAADAYVIAPSPTVTAFTSGQRFSFKVKTTNTTTSTLAVNALSATAIFKRDGATNLAAGDLVAGQVVEVEYNGTNGFMLMSPIANVELPSQTSNSGKFLTTNGTVPSWGVPTGLLYTDQDTSTIGASSTAENTVYTFTINGNSLGTAGAVHIKLYINTISQTAGSATIRYKYGGTTMLSQAIGVIAGNSNATFADVLLTANAATNAQKLNVLMNGTGGSSGFVGFQFGGAGTAAVDSTANQTFAITLQFTNSNAGNVWTKQAITAVRL